MQLYNNEPGLRIDRYCNLVNLKVRLRIYKTDRMIVNFKSVINQYDIENMRSMTRIHIKHTF